MGNYISPQFWHDTKLIEMGSVVKMLFACMITGPQTTALPGLFLATPSTFHFSCRPFTSLEIDDAFKRILDAGMAEYDNSVGLMRLPNAWKHHLGVNTNQVAGWRRIWADLPEVDLKYRHLDVLRKIAALKVASNATYQELFGGIVQGKKETLLYDRSWRDVSGKGLGKGSPKGSGKGSPNPSGSHPPTKATGKDLPRSQRDRDISLSPREERGRDTDTDTDTDTDLSLPQGFEKGYPKGLSSDSDSGNRRRSEADHGSEIGPGKRQRKSHRSDHEQHPEAGSDGEPPHPPEEPWDDFSPGGKFYRGPSNVVPIKAPTHPAGTRKD